MVEIFICTNYYIHKNIHLLDGNHVDNCELTNAGTHFGIAPFNVDSSTSDKIFSIRAAIGIGIICCSEWGRVNDMITMNFTNNTCKRFAVYANDLPEYNTDPSCITGQTFDMNGNIIQENAALTINVFYFAENQISSIQIPKCPNMHILSISILE